MKTRKMCMDNFYGKPVDVETTGKTLHALPTDTVLRADADFDAFEHEVLGDD